MKSRWIARHLQKEMWQERFGTKIVLLPLDPLQEAPAEAVKMQALCGGMSGSRFW